MMAACGLDFGTSNTTLGIMGAAGPALAPLEDGRPVLPSALFFDFDRGGVLYGRAAIEAYATGYDGRLMRSIKSVLGTDLIDADTMLKGRRIGFRAVIGLFLTEVKRRGEEASGRPLEAVVHGRPVHFVNDDAAGDRAAQAALEKIARDVGFRDISFQFEPIAAALAYEAQVNDEQIALIADIGGGTSDFSIVRIGPDRRGKTERADDILANDGVRIGGTDFDRDFSLKAVMPHLGLGSPMKRPGLEAPRSPYNDLATWSRINFLYAPKELAALRSIQRDSARPDLIGRLIEVVEQRLGHRLAMGVEEAKIALSQEQAARIDLAGLSHAVETTQAAMTAATAPLAARIGATIGTCLAQAGLGPQAIDAVFLTGGSTLLPHVRAAILARVPEARVVEGDKFGSVGQGLTIEAVRRYGAGPGGPGPL